MTQKPNGMAAAIQKTVPPKPDRPEKVHNAAGPPSRRGKRGMTVYVSPEAHADLKEVADMTDKTLNDLMIEGANIVLQQHGKKPIA